MPGGLRTAAPTSAHDPPTEPSLELAQVRDLAPLSVRGSEKAVPILTSEEGIGERRVLADVQSDINGCAALHAQKP